MKIALLLAIEVRLLKKMNLRAYLLLPFILLPLACGERGDLRPADVPANSQNLKELKEDLGFYNILSQNIPSAVVAAGPSVFEIRILSGEGPNDLVYADVTNGKGRAKSEKIMKLTTMDEQSKLILVKQLEGCVREKIDKCPTMINYRGTGFLEGDGKTLWTNAHMLKAALETSARLSGQSTEDLIQKQAKVRVFVFDQNGEMVIDPFLDEVKIKKAPTKTFVADLNGTFFSEDSDFIALSLSKEIGKPLKAAEVPLAHNARIFLLGYPGCTNCQSAKDDYVDRSPKPNSDGIGLKVTSGRILDQATVKDLIAIDFNSPSLNFDNILFYSADSHDGISGAPILNEQGEVIGIHAGGKSLKEMRLSRGVILPKQE